MGRFREKRESHTQQTERDRDQWVRKRYERNIWEKQRHIRERPREVENIQRNRMGQRQRREGETQADRATRGFM